MSRAHIYSFVTGENKNHDIINIVCGMSLFSLTVTE